MIEQLSRGFEANKQFLRKILGDESRSFLFHVLAHLFSTRAETDTTALYYELYVKNNLAEILAYKGRTQTSYIAHHVLPQSQTDTENAADLLYLVNSAALIDRYVMTIQMLRLKAAEGLTDSDKDSVVFMLTRLCKTIDDPDLHSLKAILTGTPPQSLNSQIQRKYIQALDLYVVGHYHCAALLSRSLLKEVPTSFHLYELTTKANLYSGNQYISIGSQNCLGDQIASALIDFYSGTNLINGQSQELKRLATILGNTHIGYSLHHLTSATTTIGSTNKPILISELHSLILTPKISSGLDPESREKVLEWFTKAFPASGSVQFYITKHLNQLQKKKNPKNVDKNRWSLHLAEELIRVDECEESRKILTSLLKSIIWDPNKYHRQILGAYHLLYVAYIAESDILLALRAAVDAFLFHEAAISRFDLSALKLLERKFSLEEEQSIQLPIARALALVGQGLLARSGKVVICEQAHSIYLVLDRFLVAHKCNRPSDLLAICQKFSKSDLHVVLNVLCSLPVISKGYRYANNTKELEEERLRICFYLATHAGSEYLHIRDEIALLHKRKLARSVRSHVDSSRISVGTQELIEAITNVHRTTFLRYQKFVDSEERLSTGNFSIDTFVNEGGRDISNFRFERKASETCLREIVGSTVIAFLFDENYGLNASLSKNIRHGIFLGIIRQSFEASKLITRRVSKDGPYASNIYWRSLVQQFGNRSAAELDNSLRQFSSEIDSTVMDACQNRIQIAQLIRNHGLLHSPNAEETGLEIFNYRALLNSLLNTQSRILQSALCIEDLVEIVVQKLWDETERLLEVAQSYLKSELLSRLLATISRLTNSISLLDLDQEVNSSLKRAITKSSTDVRNAITRIQTWFTKPSGFICEDVPVDGIVTAVLDTVGECTGGYLDLIDVVIENGAIIVGSRVSMIYDILLLLLNNVTEHSELPMDKVNCVLRFSIKETGIRVSVSNDVASHINLPQRQRECRELLSFNGKRYDSPQVKEGRTGLAKLKKILYFDLEQPNALIEFSTISPLRFSVDITMNKNGIVR